MAGTEKGFTLVELAIALMVIGLLIGGVLKGQELIENARVTAFVRQIKAYEAAALIFRNTYGAYPGDIKKPGSRVPNCTTDICNIGGNGNGKVNGGDTSPIDIEEFNFFPHLTKAGMIQGPEGGTQEDMDMVKSLGGNNMDWDVHEKFYPVIPVGKFWGFDSGGISYQSGKADYYFLMPAKQAMQIDQKIDDGYSGAGIMVVEDSGVDGLVEDPDAPSGYNYNPVSAAEFGLWIAPAF